jgi:hypothetical protein
VRGTATWQPFPETPREKKPAPLAAPTAIPVLDFLLDLSIADTSESFLACIRVVVVLSVDERESKVVVFYLTSRSLYASEIWLTVGLTMAFTRCLPSDLLIGSEAVASGKTSVSKFTIWYSRRLILFTALIRKENQGQLVSMGDQIQF